jgi:hypothetical protein
MRAADRLDRLEGARTPVEVVVAWAEAAHAWGSLETFGWALLDPDRESLRFDRTLRDLADGIGRHARGPMSERHRRVVAAHRHAVFLHSLVRILDGAVARTAADLGHAADRLGDTLGQLIGEDGGTIDRTGARGWVARVGAAVRAHEALGDAVRHAELRHLDGSVVAFPDTIARRDATTLALGELRLIAEFTVERHLDSTDAPAWDAEDAEVARHLDGLELAARIDAHLRLGETERARQLLGPAPSPAIRRDGDLRSDAT